MPSNLFGAKGPAKPHLVRGRGLSGEVADLRSDIDEAFTALEDGGGLTNVVEWVDPPTADVDYLMTTRASSASEDTWTSATAEATAAWVAGTEMVPPRNLTITTGAHADIDAVACVITGFVRNKLGVLIAQTDTITLTADAGATDAGTRAFSTVTSVVVPAQTGTNGAITLGFGAIIGMPSAIKTRAGLTAPTREVSGGSIVTNGTFTTAAAQPPYGTYAPNTAPDASEDYALTYEVDPAV